MHSIRNPIPELYRAVKDAELFEIKKTNAYSRGPFGDEVKYFCPEITDASRYATLAYSRWPKEGIYTMTSGYVSVELSFDNAYVDGGIVSVVISNHDLSGILNADEDDMCII